MKEPIEHFYNKFGFNKSLIKEVICGEIYLAVLLKDGRIGVCNTLNIKVDISLDSISEIDINNTDHRVLLNAYYNATLNYSNDYPKNIDIFDEIDFNKYKNVTMIGYFRSLADKFRNENINLNIFDKVEDDPELVDMDKQLEYVRNSDALVLTSTSVFNNTFLELVNSTNNNCDVFLLGPSTLMHQDMFLYRNIKVLFGSLFNVDDRETLQKIEKGFGTRSFLKQTNKVFLCKC